MGALTSGGEGVKLTIGNDADTASAVTKCGAEHQDCKVEDVVIDSVNKVVSTPSLHAWSGCCRCQERNFQID